MGILRLALAFLVMISHTNSSPWDFNPGVFAVVGFFIISGFVMTALCTKYYNKAQKVPAFYLDRILRIYPQFEVYILLCAAIIIMLGGSDPFFGTVSVRSVVLNALIIPDNYWFWVLPNNIFLPPSWSLGLELAFYAIVPFILILRLRTLAAALSLGFFLLPYLGVLDTDIWGYRLLPGTLFIFLTGSFLYSERSRDYSACGLIIWTIAACLMAGTFIRPALKVSFNREVLAGLLVFIPLIWALRWQPKIRFDRVAGDLSYGVFICHPIGVWFLRWMGVQHFGPRALAILAASSLAASAITCRAVERPFVAFRRGRLRRAEANGAASPAPQDSYAEPPALTAGRPLHAPR